MLNGLDIYVTRVEYEEVANRAADQQNKHCSRWVKGESLTDGLAYMACILCRATVQACTIRLSNAVFKNGFN